MERDANFALGDLILVPFRSRQVPALICALSDTSDVADKAVLLSEPFPLLRCGPNLPPLVTETAASTFASQPTVLDAWMRTIPKRASSVVQRPSAAVQTSIPIRETRFTVRRLADVVRAARAARGRVLIVTPWQHRASWIARELGAGELHAKIPSGTAFRTIRSFLSATDAILVATRIGAWLACAADLVILEEPENDDHKQDELNPRYDARAVIELAARLRPELSVLSVSTTPRLSRRDDWATAAAIPVELETEAWTKRGGSSVELLSPRTLQRIEEALTRDERVEIIHPISGERARLACRDCGWVALCAFCAHGLAQNGNRTLCKRCGRAAPMPASCATCGGTDLSRGSPGVERLRAQCASVFGSEHVRVTDPFEFDATADALPPTTFVVITNLALLGGGEDIRRRERIIIAFRRIATRVGRLRVQGPEDLISECGTWLTADGFAAAWTREMEDRKKFGFPPAVPLAKLLVDGDERTALDIARDLAPYASGPFPVEHRSFTRKPRWVIHVRGKADLAPYRSRAFIDLDPVAFFS